ncbi:MAG: hypothetical protein IKS55_01195 [Oscillospiraceae bacterium]|nr:hypothetical protein [Oscillospiraceae bacterium]
MNEEKKLSSVGQDILQSGRTQLCMALPYLSGEICALVPVPGDEVTVSAATDGENLYYNASFLAAGFLKSERFSARLNLHMMLHCLFRHPAKRRGRDAALWDLACDAAVESVIDSLPYACLTQRSAPARELFLAECRRGMKVLSAEGIYRMLLRERPPEYRIAGLQRLFAMDDHSLWDPEEKQEKERSERQDHFWQNAASRSQTAMDSLLSEHGSGGENVMEQLSVAARDDVDYRKFLRRFAAPREILKADSNAFDYIYYTYGLRHYGNMPLIEPPETREEKRIEDFVIAIDTSMSTSGTLVREFLASTYAILRNTDSFTRKLNVHILQCDDQLRSDQKITSLDELRRYMENLTLSGGSATDFRPVFEHVDKLVASGSFSSLRGLLYFTDGMGIYPTRRPDYETAFVLLEEPPLSVKIPPWAIRIVPSLPWRKPRESFDEFWQEEILPELPEL